MGLTMPPQTADRKAYRKWYHANEPQSVKDARIAWKKTEKGKRCIRNVHLKKTYGITLADYEAKQVCQENRCAICGMPGERFKKGLHVDHSHKTNKVRGLLCIVCNTALAKIEDQLFMERAKAYLQGWD
jgi:hypothetical protein